MLYSIYKNHEPDFHYAKRAPWFPPSSIAKMLQVIEDFDSRIIIDSDFSYDVSLAKSLAKSIIDNKQVDLNEFYRLYCGLIDAYNRGVAAFNRQVSNT